MLSFAVLLTVHNRKQDTLNCLKKLYQQEGLNSIFTIDTYLVDDGSTDGTSAAIRKNFPDINIIPGDGNLYWNRGMHLAWNVAHKAGEFDYFFWLNDDTMLYPNCINTLLESARIHQNEAIIVGTTQSLLHPSRRVTYGGRDINNNMIIPNGTLQECRRFNGNIVLIPQYVFDRVGYNDAFYHHSWGDFDYGLRASKFGIHSFIAPEILGSCERNPGLPIWCDPQKSIQQRIKHFNKPTGARITEAFIFEHRYYGLHKACYNYVIIILKLLFPKRWA